MHSLIQRSKFNFQYVCIQCQISWLDWVWVWDLRVGLKERYRAPDGADKSNNDEDGKRRGGVYCLVYCPQTGTASKQGGANLLVTENNTRYISQDIILVIFPRK